MHDVIINKISRFLADNSIMHNNYVSLIDIHVGSKINLAVTCSDNSVSVDVDIKRLKRHRVSNECMMNNYYNRCFDFYLIEPDCFDRLFSFLLSFKRIGLKKRKHI